MFQQPKPKSICYSIRSRKAMQDLWLKTFRTSCAHCLKYLQWWHIWSPILGAIGEKSQDNTRIMMPSKVTCWLHDPTFIDKKYKKLIECIVLEFQFLVSEINPWITSNALVFVRQPIHVHKAIGWFFISWHMGMLPPYGRPILSWRFHNS